ncbi:MAG: 16S rRNA (cytosine(967)-C(5))-methyltransferase RsmB [Eubacteriales bacterium]
MKKNIDYPREVTIKILYEINHEGAYINIALHQFLENKKLSELDKSFVHQLVYGTIKNINYIDWMIAKYSKIKLKKISPWIKEILRIAIFQIFFLQRVPDFAAVDESVQLSKKYSRGKSEKFVNAVLRNVLRDKESIEKQCFNSNELLTIKYSCPQWLVQYLMGQYSYEKVRLFLEKSMETAPVTIRLNTLKCTKEQLKSRLHQEGIQYQDGKLCSEALRISDFSDITGYSAYQEGLFTIQDEAAIMVVDILHPEPGDNILDMCSAPGGKTTHIGEKLKGQPGLVSRDIYDHKIKLIQNNCDRLGLFSIQMEMKNGLVFYEEDKEKYDKILLDAPCSGLGILRRKPDIKIKLKKDHIEDMIKIQKKLIKNAYAYLKTNGILVYSTCTINMKENEEIIEYLLSQYPQAKVIPPAMDDKNLIYKDKYIQTFPDTGGADGFFICKIQKWS